jgi:hypothetical protein
MLFRTEEVDPCSPQGALLRRDRGWKRGVADDGLRLGGDKFVVPHFNSDFSPTVETRGIQANYLAREVPANRQRFGPSLAKPLLLAVYSEAVLVRKAMEGSERDDVVCTRVDPGRYPCGHQLMEEQTPFLH